MRYYLILWFVLHFGALSAQKDQESASLIEGEYMLTGFNMAASLKLENEIFHHNVSVWWCDGGEDLTEAYIGVYKFDNHKIVFSPQYYIKDKDTVAYDAQKHDFREKLFVIHWDYEVFLLSEDKLSAWGYPSSSDFLFFINDINSGAIILPNPNTYWRKEVEVIGMTDIKKMLPVEWQSLLLDSPINANIIAVDKYKGKEEYDVIKSVITIDKGLKQGLKIGMGLYGADCSCDIELFSVKNNSSQGYAKVCGPSDCSIGTKLSTYLERERKTFSYYKLVNGN